MSEEPTRIESTRSRAPIWHRHSAGQVPVDKYDHEIKMVDTTVRAATPSPAPTAQDDSTGTESAEGRRTRIKASVRKHQNDWAYRKFQRDQCSEEYPAASEEPSGSSEGRQSKDTYGASTLRRKYGEIKDRIPKRQQKKDKGHAKKPEFEIDILYENQRGAFFCGIPLYSHNSLLNFDPAAWQTSEFKESPVNITNAQPPDPTWTWVWKTWYVDMSHDVDEEGWEYSLSFRQGFAWHGTHPWFHSFVRRRRWLRKRVKANQRSATQQKDALHDAHKLNLDYFTIHSTTRESSTSRDVGSAAPTSQRYSAVLPNKYEADHEDEDEEIANMPILMQALKKATVDRKKLNLLRSFIIHGGQELVYLAERIPEILDLLVYQTSRREVLAELQRATAWEQAEDKAELQSSTSKGKEAANNDAHAEPSDDKSRRLAALEESIYITQSQIQDFEYWSDIKATVQDAEELDVPPRAPAGQDLAKGTGDPFPATASGQDSSKTTIKGIPKGAGVGKEIGIARRGTLRLQGEHE